MRYIIIALVFLTSCYEIEINHINHFNCMSLQVSDASPIQFWVNGEETYNEKQACHMKEACFCQEFQCDDDIKLVFNDNEDGSFEAEVIDYPTKSHVVIVGSEVIPPSLWVDTQPFSSKNGTQFITNVPQETAINQISRQDLLIDIGDQTVDIEILIDVVGTFVPGGSGGFQISITSDSNLNAATDVITTEVSGLVLTIPAVEISGSNCTYLNIEVGSYLESGSAVVTLTIPTGLIVNPSDQIQIINRPPLPLVEDGDLYTADLGSYLRGLDPLICEGEFIIRIIDKSSYDIVFISDCIRIVENSECSTLIGYSNPIPYAGLDTDGDTYYLRVPARFYHERSPTEGETDDRSDGVIVELTSSIKKQRLLETKPMPDYMHHKLKLVLRHKTVTIDGKTWKQEEGYDVNELHRNFPLKTGEVYLTEQGSIVRNVYST